MINTLLTANNMVASRLAVECLYNKCLGFGPVLSPLEGLNHALLNSPLVDKIYTIASIPIWLMASFLNRYDPFLPKERILNLDLREEFYIPLAEEFIFRKIIQGTILHKIPERILKKVAPEHIGLLNHPLSKIARNILTSALFAVCHAPRVCKYRPDSIMAYFALSLVLGHAQENGASIISLSLAHTLHNIAAAVQHRQIGF